MTDDKQKEIQKETLWDYTEGKATLETFHAEFRKKADNFAALSKILREDPDMINARRMEFAELRDYLDSLPKIAEEFREAGTKNAERRDSLIRMGVNLPEGF